MIDEQTVKLDEPNWVFSNKSSADAKLTIRDDWQIEGQLDILPQPGNGSSFWKSKFLSLTFSWLKFWNRSRNQEARVTQEFFLFIPAALHVNEHTYSKEQFYLDRTNLLRFKTPQVALDELLNRGDPRSPFTLIEHILSRPIKAEEERAINSELKLAANIIRSQFRDHSIELIERASSANAIEIKHDMVRLLELLQQVRLRIDQIDAEAMKRGAPRSVFEHISHVQEFVSRSVEQISLQAYRGLSEQGVEVEELKKQALDEKLLRSRLYHEPLDPSALNEEQKEQFLYREGLLNKFALSALLLATKRSSFVQKYGELTASLAAGVAMSLYLLFFFWKGAFLIDSISLLVVASFVYVLKDRIKEGLKNLLQQQASQWFDDFETEVLGPHDKKLGVIGEHFHLLDPVRLPKEVVNIRNLESPESLAKVLRPETVLYYKKRIRLRSPKKGTHDRRFDYHHLFRLNLSELLKRASNPHEERVLIDTQKNEIQTIQFPKIYHLNLLMKTVQHSAVGDITTLERFRIIANKNGILRIESVFKIS